MLSFLLLTLSGASGYLLAPMAPARPSVVSPRAYAAMADDMYSQAELEEMNAFNAALQEAAAAARDPATVASVREEAQARAAALAAEDSITKKLAAGGPDPKDKFLKSIKKPKGTMALIGEGVQLEVVSMGGFDLNDPAYLSSQYREGGAAAVCVGVPPRLVISDDALSKTVSEQETARGDFPGPLNVVVRDDFVDPAQLAAAAVAGAKAVVMNVAHVDEGGLGGLVSEAERLGLETIVRVANEAELGAAVDAGAKMVCIGDCTLDAAAELVAKLPVGVLSVADVPTRDVRGVWQIRDMGFNALIIGKGLLDVCVRDRVPPTAVIKAMLSKGSVKYGLGMQKGRLEGSKENLGTIAM